jgi:N-acetylmuramoyl-L-alanine amidase
MMGIKERDDLYVLNGTNMPAILVELGFISHPKTEQKLGTSEYKQLPVNAVTDGIKEYLVL